jgi:hypothetical protein
MAISTDIVLFNAQTADANGAAADWHGGRGVFSAFGTFGSGTVKLQWSPNDGTTWLNVDKSGDTYVTYTANGSGGFELPACKIRAVLSGSTAASVSAEAAVAHP